MSTAEQDPAGPDPIPIPRRRSDPCQRPDEYATLREERPVARLLLADGSLGWLLTRYADVCTLLTDPRFTARDRVVSEAVRVLPATLTARLRDQQSLLNMDPPEHTRLRRLLAAQFSVRRMRRLLPRIRRIVADRVAALQAAGAPADLVPLFAQPIPLLVICELLGVPEADRAEFQNRSMLPQRLGEDLAAVLRASDEMYEYMRRLTLAKRAEPADDVLSALADPANGLTEVELAGLGTTLLVAGFETTANMIGLGCYLLLRDPERYAALVAAVRADPDGAGQSQLPAGTQLPPEADPEADPDADPDRMEVAGEPALVESAVEELLRYLTIMQFGLNRRAVAEVPIGGELIRPGEMVYGALASANTDPRRFPDPDRFDLERGRTAHLAFGYGVHQCVGQLLARLELRVALAELARRLPALRLAVPAAEVPMRQDMVIYGVHRLPVTW
jgi:cytochrome P450